MKVRVKVTSWKQPANHSFYYIVEMKKHWWNRWKYVEDFSGDNHMPLLFPTKRGACRYAMDLCDPELIDKERESALKIYKESHDAFRAFCENIINGMYISVPDAAKEQLMYLENIDNSFKE